MMFSPSFEEFNCQGHLEPTSDAERVSGSIQQVDYKSVIGLA